MNELISSPAALDYKIDNLFFDLTTLKPEEHVKAKLDEIFSHLKTHKRFIQASTLAMLFKRLGELENYKQALAKDLMVFGINFAEPLLSKKQLFGRNELVQIFNAVPKLPISWEIYRDFIRALKAQLGQELKKEAGRFTESQLCSILGALAKLGFPGTTPLPLIVELINTLNPTEERLDTFSNTALCELWQFCVFAKVKFPEKRKKIAALLDNIDTTLSKNPREPTTPSNAHLSILAFLKANLFKPEYTDALQIEHVVGAYSLDIALIEAKLNIEVDGGHHYREGRLIRNHNFRDFVLGAYGEWTTVRISLEDYQQLRTHKERCDYLREKLKKFEHLLIPPSPTHSPVMAKIGLLPDKGSKPVTTKNIPIKNLKK